MKTLSWYRWWTLITICTKSGYWHLTSLLNLLHTSALNCIVLLMSHPLNNHSSPGIWSSGDLTLHHWLSCYCYILKKCVALSFGGSKLVKNTNKG